MVWEREGTPSPDGEGEEKGSLHWQVLSTYILDQAKKDEIQEFQSSQSKEQQIL